MPPGVVLVVHPSADLYGSDLQLLESIQGLVTAGWRVVATVPGPGPLVARLEATGAEVRILPVPVLRKSLLRPTGLLRLLGATLRALPGMRALVRDVRPDVVYVNTITVPAWLLVGRLAGRPVLGHVHEAENELPRPLAFALNAPLLLARTIVVNSRAARTTLLRAVPALQGRTSVVHNGVAEPPTAEGHAAVPPGGPQRIVLVGRLSPRKGTDVALEAVARLVARGRDVELELYGTVFPGYEWFEDQLRERSAEPDLAGRVHFGGYVSPTWPALARADVVLVPSRAEPFGNAAVEAQLAGRPVVVSDVQGLPEIVTHRRTGLLVPPDDADALAAAVAEILDDPGLARALAVEGRRSAREHFGQERYRRQIADMVAATLSS